MRSLILLSLLVIALAGCADSVSQGEGYDTDGDGFTDQQEIDAGSDPSDANSTPLTMRQEETVSLAETGLIVLGNEDVASGAGCGYLDVPDTASWTWSILPPTGASAGQVSNMVFTATYPVTMAEGDIYVFDPTGALITPTTTFVAGVPGIEGFTDTVNAPGPFQTGDFLVEVRGCLGAGQVSMDATATLSYIPA